jgi:hypothetical protein
VPDAGPEVEALLPSVEEMDRLVQGGLNQGSPRAWSVVLSQVIGVQA